MGVGVFRHTMIGPFLAVSTAATAALLALVTKKHIERVGNNAMLWLIYASTFVFALAFALATPPYKVNVDVAAPLAISLVCNSVGLYLYYSALRMTQLSVLAPVMALSPALTMVSGYFINHEVPSATAKLGIVVISGAAWILLANTKGAWSWASASRAMGAMLLWTISCPFDKLALKNTSTLWYTVLLDGALAVVFLPFAFKLTKRDLLVIGPIVGFIGLLGAVTQFEALRYLPVAVVVGLKRLSAVFSVILAYFFLKEPQPVFKLIMTVIMLVGSVLILVGT